jgi:hypothetical protein
MTRACALLLLGLGASAGLVVQAPGGAVAARPTTPAVHMMARWSEPILNEDLPDPVFDKDIGYKGRVPWGFCDAAEKLNGRAAMMGFTILFLQELVVGKGVLEQYGLPYDAGAIIMH